MALEGTSRGSFGKELLIVRFSHAVCGRLGRLSLGGYVAGVPFQPRSQETYMLIKCSSHALINIEVKSNLKQLLKTNQ